MAKGNNSKEVKLFHLLLLVAVLLMGGATAWGILYATVEHNCKQLINHKAKIEAHETAVTEIKSDVKHIRSDIAEQKVMLAEIQKELRER